MFPKFRFSVFLVLVGVSMVLLAHFDDGSDKLMSFGIAMCLLGALGGGVGWVHWSVTEGG